MIALCLGAIFTTGFAQNDADPAITSFSFATSPVMEQQTTTATVFFINGGFTTAIAAGKVGINISLPTSGEYVAFPESILALSGTALSKFNFTYDPATKNFFGINNQDIAAGDGGTLVVKVKGIITVLSRISVANIQRLQPAFYPNENTNNNSLTAALGVVPATVVAIGNLTFNAVKQAKVVNLDWQTSSEQNSKHFEVEFSRDGSTWQKLGTVNAAGNSTSATNYTFVHSTPVTGLNYYRLKLVNIDGTIKYSVVRTVKFSGNTKITVMPNPTTDRVFISSNEGGIMQSIEIFSAEGKKLQQVNNFTMGNSIDLSNFSPATYVLRITDKTGNTEVLRIIKN